MGNKVKVLYLHNVVLHHLENVEDYYEVELNVVDFDV